MDFFWCEIVYFELIKNMLIKCTRLVLLVAVSELLVLARVEGDGSRNAAVLTAVDTAVDTAVAVAVKERIPLRTENNWCL